MISEMKFFHSFIALEKSSNKGMLDSVGTLRPQQSKLTTHFSQMGRQIEPPANDGNPYCYTYHKETDILEAKTVQQVSSKLNNP